MFANTSGWLVVLGVMLLLCYGQVSFLSLKDRVVCNSQIQERRLSGLKENFPPMASASLGLFF